MFWSESGEKSAQITHRLQDKTVQNSSKQLFVCIVMWETTGDFSLEEALWWIMDSYFGQKWPFESKTSWWICFLQTRSFCLLKKLTDGLEWIIVMFLSAVWTLILTAPIHCIMWVQNCFYGVFFGAWQLYLFFRKTWWWMNTGLAWTIPLSKQTKQVPPEEMKINAQVSFWSTQC